MAAAAAGSPVAKEEGSSSRAEERRGGAKTPRGVQGTALQRAAQQALDVTLAELAAVPSDTLSLGARLACLAYTDDVPGTARAYETPVLRGTLLALQAIAGGPSSARTPLSDILRTSLGFSLDRTFSHGGRHVDTQGYIAHNGAGDVVLAFRGTTCGLDWLTNIECNKVDFEPFVDKPSSQTWLQALTATCACGGGATPQVHHGFYDALEVALADIDEVLLPLLRASPEPKRLIVTGHSLGGALATGAFAYLLGRFDFGASPHAIHLVTLGSPRLGDARFVKEVDRRAAALRRASASKCTVARIVHSDDSVPTVPPEFLGFEHLGGLHRLQDCSKLTEERELLGEQAIAAPHMSMDLVKDHEPVRYLRAIDEYVSSTLQRRSL